MLQNNNLFQTIVPFFTPWKMSENHRISDLFRGYRNGTLAWNVLMATTKFIKDSPKVWFIILLTFDRSSHPEVFLRKGVLKIWSKFSGEHPCRSVISIKLQRNFIEIALRHGCFPVNLQPIFRTLFLKNFSGRLILFQVTFFYLLWVVPQITPSYLV